MAVDWTSDELTTLGAIADAFVPGSDAEARGSLMAEALATAADPDQVRDLRLALRALRTPAANALLGGGWRSFSAMDQARRERTLRSWGESRLAQRRSAFHALRKLATFLAYAVPHGPDGPDTPNPRFAAIGYQPERPPLAEEPTTVVPLALPFDDGVDRRAVDARRGRRRRRLRGRRRGRRGGPRSRRSIGRRARGRAVRR